jgi:hypothetical protein
VPQGTSGTAGYTTVSSTGTIGTPTIGQTVTVPITTLNTPGTITIVYGSGGGTSGATAPVTTGTATFIVKSKVSATGTLTNIATQPTVTVSPGAATRLDITAGTSQIAGESFSVTVTAKDGQGYIDTNFSSAIAFSANKTDVTLPAGNQFLPTGTGTGTFEVMANSPMTELTITVYKVSNDAVRGTSNLITVSGPTIGTPINVAAWDDANDQGGRVVVRWDKSTNDPFAGIGRAVPAATPVTGQPGRPDGYNVLLYTSGNYTGAGVETYTVTVAVGGATYGWTSIGNGSGSGFTPLTTFTSVGTLGLEIAFSAAPGGGEQWTIRCTPAYSSGDNAVTEYRVLRGDDKDGNGQADEYHFVASQKPDADAVPSTDVDTYVQDGPGDSVLGVYYIVAYSGTEPSPTTLEESSAPQIWSDFSAPGAKVGDIFIVDELGASLAHSALSNPAEAMSIDDIPPDAVTDVKVVINGNSLVFTWTAITSGQGKLEIQPVRYKVYRAANEAYFTPGPANLYTIVDSTSETTVTYTDSGAVGDVNNNYFYVVKAFDGSNESSFDSDYRVGEYDVQLISTETTDWNLVAAPVGGEDITKASQLQNAIPNANAVAYWDAALQGGVQYVPGIEPTNFPVTRGYPYYVNVTADAIWTTAGALTAPTFNLITTEGTDWNIITVPLDKVDITKASELQADIPNANAVAYWDATLQGGVQYVPGIEPTNFPVRVGRAYYVNVTANGTWPESGQQASPAKQLLSSRGQLSDQIFGTSPHIVYGVVETSKGAIPKAAELTITAFIKDRPSDILTHDIPQNPGTPVKIDYKEEGGIWLVQIAGFGKWSPGETLRIDFHDKSSGQSGYHEIILISDEPVQNLSEKVLRLSAPVPKQSALLQNYPNPFNPETWIPYKLAHSSDVTVTIYNIQGQLVRALNLGHQEAGFYVDKESAAYWDGRNDSGEQIASGVYFYQIKAGTFNATKRLVILK